jgi:hypothetical protein
MVATSPAAFAAVNVQHVELADQIRKDNYAIAGHCLTHWPQLEPSFISNVDTDIYNSREV